jgi:hypothetical protein
MSITQTYVDCGYWDLGYAQGDEFCNVILDEGPFMGRKKKKKPSKILVESPIPVRKNDDDLIMAIVGYYLEDEG